ncbi:hypothetical protein [Actinophytocola sp.]|uniref:hypothetical protein n=1 Tax=Actinophytocola sp. TaxID=1872138 RepID=UPI00389A3C6B
MTKPNEGFAVNVAELDRLAAALPAVADALRPPIAVLGEHTPTPRPRQIAAVSRLEKWYGTFTQEIAARQRVACDRIVDTAGALHDIAQVYRRVDGQG